MFYCMERGYFHVKWYYPLVDYGLATSEQIQVNDILMYMHNDKWHLGDLVTLNFSFIDVLYDLLFLGFLLDTNTSSSMSSRDRLVSGFF